MVGLASRDRSKAAGASPAGAGRWSGREKGWPARQRNSSLLVSARQLQAHVRQAPLRHAEALHQLLGLRQLVPSGARHAVDFLYHGGGAGRVGEDSLSTTPSDLMKLHLGELTVSKLHSRSLVDTGLGLELRQFLFLPRRRLRQ